MPQSAYLDEAVRWSKGLTQMRSRGPGDTDIAMRAIAREYGVSYAALWRLRYRRSSLKDIGVSVYMKLKAAYEAECRRQLGKLRDEIAITEAACGASSDLLDAAKALVREADGGRHRG
ncbi:hypothetical protein [Bradyrhizobium ivorense]|uniref:hypothetical protein n=1 Tax=Bradyrhizobium ivorense TaxID=2511166 RepID=UPI0010B68DBA|nr:hypothetical protein [Bradyrhizobium ivorense]VIO73859.1 hypothetical protein CI41S_39680 [Bradyrhizobium ivorense]